MDIAKMIQDEIDKAIEEAVANPDSVLEDGAESDLREYHFVVSYVKDKGWLVDTAQLVQRYPNGAIWDPETEEWQKETDFVSDYSSILSNLLERLDN